MFTQSEHILIACDRHLLCLWWGTGEMSVGLGSLGMAGSQEWIHLFKLKDLQGWTSKNWEEV